MKLVKLVSIVAILGTLWSCQREEVELKLDDSDQEEVSTQNIEIKKLFGSEVPVLKQEDGTYLLGGKGSDMLVFESNFDGPNTAEVQIPQLPGRSGITILGSGQIRKWPQNTVIYRIGNLTTEMRSNFQLAIQEWESKTTIRFKERTDENFYVNVERTGDNCFCGVASLGVQGNRGILRFGSRAPLSVIIHEIGHTLGFIHEQNRADREDYVQINFENIVDGARDQFFIANNATPLTAELDLNSIMMYGSFTFSKNRRPTIVDLNGNRLPRNSGRLSAGDISGTIQAYPGAQTGTDDEEEEEDDDDDGGVTTPTTPVSACDGIAEFNRNTNYRVGDRVTFRGYLFERDFSRWILVKSCDDIMAVDICEGVSAYNRNTNYGAGDKVTFRGELYRRAQNGWINEGRCGN